ncbi:hypothetical protein SK803_03930 [Lentzea sp. BCCO 10_0856]|uniref:Serine/threonine protein kinase n=1 Tax=Lentzea miocenica TaxID=3095431 RepID=A0ABU4STV3_9PSEU|nr:hypothetical protein [Lentzea sp. BCCO 10_0856]MDX8029342.1 hypothetical protein [Lentzea sp. BCCO 10_0856]
MKHSDELVDNGVDGDVSGTSFQAGSIGGDVYLGTPAKPRSRKGLWYLTVPAAAAVMGITALVWELDEPGRPTFATATPTTDTSTTSAPAATTGSPARSTAAGAARPAPGSQAPRPSGGAPVAVTSVPTTTVAVAVAPPPAGNDVRYSGTVPFGSYNLDLPQPRDVDGMNVWPLTPGRLHGDEGYWLAEWVGDGVPGRDECAADLTQRATRDAENLIVGSRVCGKTPGGRIFLVQVVAMDSATITGQVTVWE